MQWVQVNLKGVELEEQCRVLTAADYLDMHSLMIAIASTRRTWSDIDAMRGFLSRNVFRFLADNAPGLIRLNQVARTARQKAIGERIHRCLVAGGHVAFVHTEPWDSGLDVLQWAAEKGRRSIVELLVTGPGIDVNAPSPSAQRLLHWAAFWGWVNLVEVLLVSPTTDVNARDNDRPTPLHCAAVAGRNHVVKVLLSFAGIQVNAGDASNKTALHWAVWSGPSSRHSEVVELLLRAPGINANARDQDLMTPLHWAVTCRRGYAVRLLLATPGIDVQCRDKAQMTPLQSALVYGNQEIVGLLVNATVNAASVVSIRLA